MTGETGAAVGQYAGADAWRNELLLSRTGVPKPLLAISHVSHTRRLRDP
jgi:hypothetical protein